MVERGSWRKIAEKLAWTVRDEGGRAYYVGGCVRDEVLGGAIKDVDIEVYGIEPVDLKPILESLGKVDSFGLSFAIYSLRGYGIDIAVPRREKNIGSGHKDFEVCADPQLEFAEASKRRDFTINSMLKDILTGEVLDPHGGLEDLKAKVIRHIDSNSFVEDPLRVLRAAQFAARLEFEIAASTISLCRDIDIASLPKERIEREMKKALLEAEKPSIFFYALKDMNQLASWFGEVMALDGLLQEPAYHPEGDVFAHTMQVLDRAAGVRDRADFPYAFMLLALTHDFGKIVATERIGGKIHAYGHEYTGIEIAEKFLRRLMDSEKVINYVLSMIPLHMKPNMIAHFRSAIKSSNKLFDAAISPKDLIYMALADKPVKVASDAFAGNEKFLFERLDLYNEMMTRPYVQGRDLVDAGLKPGAYFKELLAYAHKLRLAGIDKETALKQTLAYYRKMCD